MPRSGVYIAGATAAGAISWEAFIRMDLTSGTYRYTTFNMDISANIDGDTETWTSYPINVGALSQSNQNPLDLSWVEILDLDRVWTPLIFGSNTPRGKPISIWICQLDPLVSVVGVQPQPVPVTVRSTLGIWSGTISGGDLDEKGVIRLSLNAAPLWTLTVLRETTPNCQHDFKDENCQYTGVDTTCKKTRVDCTNRTGGSNILHFDGADWMPLTDQTLYWNGQALKPQVPYATGAPVGNSSVYTVPGPLGGDPTNARMPIVTVGGRRGVGSEPPRGRNTPGNANAGPQRPDTRGVGPR
jgi:hypothetical protein